MLSATLTFAQTHDCDITEKCVDWGNNISFIFMRDQHSPPPLNNTLIGITPTLSSWGIKIRHPLWPMLNGVITSTLSSWGIKIRHPLWPIWGHNIIYIFMRDQNQEGGTSTPGKRPGCSEHVSEWFVWFVSILIGFLFKSWKMLERIHEKPSTMGECPVEVPSLEQEFKRSGRYILLIHRITITLSWS